MIDVPPTLRPDDWLDAARAAFRQQCRLAELAARQLDDAQFARRPPGGGNSVAVIFRHLAGNLTSRFADFLTTDGEKPGRDRDAEFADWPSPRAELMAEWDAGWATLSAALDGLSAGDAGRTVTIRGEPHTVAAAVLRSLAHVSYHVGQVTLLARLAHGEDGWRWLTIPPGESAAHDGATWGTAASRGAAATEGA